MNRESIKEYAAAQRQRYRLEKGKQGRGRIVDEVVAVTGYHRKGAIRLLNRRDERSPQRGRRGRSVVYGPAIGATLRLLWEATGRVGVRRLQPFIPSLLERLRECGELDDVAPEMEQLLRDASQPTIWRLLKPARAIPSVRGWSNARSRSQIKKQIPIRTFGEWDGVAPGSLAVDLVAHCGASAEGSYLHTLTVLDVASGWVELEAVPGKGQHAVRSALHRARQRVPVPSTALHSDNGSEFINYHLLSYCRQQGIGFTRSRAFKKNDNAWVEQKNGAIVRQTVGRWRYASRPAQEQLRRVYELVRLQGNFFQPVQKLVSKNWQGNRQIRIYDGAKTPYERLLQAGVLAAASAARLSAIYSEINPLELEREIAIEVQKLWTLRVGAGNPASSNRPAYGNPIYEAQRKVG